MLDLHNLLEIPEEALWAMDCFGDSATDRFCRDIMSDAIESDGNSDWGEYLALVPLELADLCALVILAAIDHAPWMYSARDTYVKDWTSAEITAESVEHYARTTYAVVYSDSQGFGYPDFYESEDEARADFSARAERYREEDEDEEESEDVPESEIPGTDAFARKYPLREEVRQAEIWGGTE